ncbi:MAG: radical SAM protein, partial [Candidatus Omnitrophica bacterium]|nr:radical SAM protein [Candidatus Omnitrophota bacterium]
FVYSLNSSSELSKLLEEQLEMQFGISYISSFLKERGYKTSLLILNRKSSPSLVDEYIKATSPLLICFSAVATEYAFIEKVARGIKCRFPGIFLMIGGVHVSLCPEDAMLDVFDVLCINEGEFSTFELAKQLADGVKPSGIANLWIKHDEGIEKNSLRPFLQDLDSLPFPDRDMWQPWVKNLESRFGVLLGRGCPFSCTYCCNHVLKKLAVGNYVRYRSPENILREVEYLVEKFPGLKEIYLEVETIGAAKLEWALELCVKLKIFNARRDLPVSFGVNLRVIKYEPGLEKLFIAFKESNFRHINIGLESGSERVRYEILKRNYTNEDIVKTVDLARKYGLEVWFYNLIGLPGETAKDFKETIRMNRLCQPDFHYLSIFYPYPGTQLYSVCKKRGLLNQSSHEEKIERMSVFLDMPEFPSGQIEEQFIWFDYFVYKGFRPPDQLLRDVASKFCLVYRKYSKFKLKLKFFKDVSRQLFLNGDYLSGLVLLGFVFNGFNRRLLGAGKRWSYK